MVDIIRLESFDITVLAFAGQLLSRGGLIVYPTETFYAIAADYQNYYALVRLQNLKRRDQGKPFPLIMSKITEIETISYGIPKTVEDIVDRYWPGPLTLVFTARPKLSHVLLSKNGGIGVRISSNSIATGLAWALGRAITATSANLSSQPPVIRIEDLDSAIIAGVDLILDNGPTPGGLPSTILDVRTVPPQILRKGKIII